MQNHITLTFPNVKDFYFGLKPFYRIYFNRIVNYYKWTSSAYPLIIEKITVKGPVRNPSH